MGHPGTAAMTSGKHLSCVVSLIWRHLSMFLTKLNITTVIKMYVHLPDKKQYNFGQSDAYQTGSKKAGSNWKTFTANIYSLSNALIFFVNCLASLVSHANIMRLTTDRSKSPSSETTVVHFFVSQYLILLAKGPRSSVSYGTR